MTEIFEVICDDTSTITRAEWLLLRRQGLGSSDAAAAMSLSPWTSAYKLWAEKSGLLPETPDNERFLWGRLHEPLILDQAEARGWLTGKSVSRNLMIRNIERPWMLANPDSLTEAEVVEAKTADAWTRPKWDAGVPDQYVIQAMWLMEVTGRRTCVVPVLFGGNDLQRYVIEYDPEIADQMVGAAEVMWERIKTNDPPDPDASEASMMALREVYDSPITGGAVELPLHMEALLDDRRLWSQRKKDTEAYIDGVKAAVMFHMGNDELALIAGEPVATWSPNKNGSRVFRWHESKGSK